MKPIILLVLLFMLTSSDCREDLQQKIKLIMDNPDQIESIVNDTNIIDKQFNNSKNLVDHDKNHIKKYFSKGYFIVKDELIIYNKGNVDKRLTPKELESYRHKIRILNDYNDKFLNFAFRKYSHNKWKLISITDYDKSPM